MRHNFKDLGNEEMIWKRKLSSKDKLTDITNVSDMLKSHFIKLYKTSQIKLELIQYSTESFCKLDVLKKFDTWFFVDQLQIVSRHKPLPYLTPK